MAVIEPKLYHKNNGLQKADAKYVLEKYFHLLKVETDAGASVLDVGCGVGDVTCEMLLPRLQKTIDKIVAIDSSEDMIGFAKSKWRTPKVIFSKMDISAASVPVDFEQTFQHIFSFYCLHWVMQQRQAVRNLYELLKPGGNMLLVFLASNPIYTIYENLARNNKWKPYMQNFKKYISPYHHSQNPADEFKRLLYDAGFDTNTCKVIERSYTFPNFSVLKKSVSAVCPFLAKIPENLKNEYLLDYTQEVRKVEYVNVESINNNNEEKINVQYQLFVVIASKRT